MFFPSFLDFYIGAWNQYFNQMPKTKQTNKPMSGRNLSTGQKHHFHLNSGKCVLFRRFPKSSRDSAGLGNCVVGFPFLFYTREFLPCLVSYCSSGKGKKAYWKREKPTFSYPPQLKQFSKALQFRAREPSRARVLCADFIFILKLT